MFAGSTLFLGLDIADLLVRFRVVLTEGSDLDGIASKMALADKKLQPVLWTGEILFVFMLILGDSIVLWRTWALYVDQRTIIIVPFLTWLGSMAAALFEFGCDIRTDWTLEGNAPSVASHGLAACAHADVSSFTLSYATNIICTSLIFSKAWQFRKGMKAYFGTARAQSEAEKILMLFIKSGLLYLVIYTLQAIPIYGGSTPGSLLVWETVNAIIQQAFGMYPTALVVLVELQKSLWDAEEVSRQISDLRFAPNTVTSPTTISDPAILSSSGGGGNDGGEDGGLIRRLLFTRQLASPNQNQKGSLANSESDESEKRERASKDDSDGDGSSKMAESRG
ncbi:hypothetical protein AX17_005506 [Amanita inopinata Kibby_2008]|nr:hypothetical protein AX17_005506 [Amanita inopinata Kibby_2008]